ncbi:AAA-like domain-containing protein [Candidatus Marithrix sp. Canyon 246]|uniref:AAA-like domain-containing protein n=3 Tax=Candidatus Marithrix sp. Canyon 246 TaxID=1827136 RepID=UPI00084A18F5|nr:AAA-like domain-containing protein [Candidatus Marithrix sp. Canyon 246]
MQKFFNTAGPCVPSDHYMVSITPQFKNLKKLIDDKRYSILHAPRQTGKTTMMLQLMEHLNLEGKYIALYVNVEAGQAWRNKITELNQSIITQFRLKAKIYLPKEYQPSADCFENIGNEFSFFLSNWCLELPKPLVVFMDEVDALIGDGLISVLRQLRSGYTQRPKAFPHAMCLIGLRDIRDYRIYSDSSKRYIIGGSAFNIKEKSIFLNNFTYEQVKELYAQHIEATGQKFTHHAIQQIFELTQGQPWLVNALGRELCFDDYAIAWNKTISKEDVNNAAEILIKRRDVHLDQLADKLTEPRVERIIQSILIGEEIDHTNINEDQQYLIDLGLIRLGKQALEIANPIYREIIPRELTVYRQNMLAQDPLWYVKPDGKLDIQKVLEAYIKFYKENSELVTKRKTYNEAAHHLLFMAWLQRIVNGGGYITREYAAGLKRLDLCIDFAGERFAFELKLSSKNALNDGKTQLVDYLRRLSLDSGWLIIFNRNGIEDWDAVGKREWIEEQGKKIELICL